MIVKKSDIKTWAQNNGVPGHGDFYEGWYKGEMYGAEYYGEQCWGTNSVELNKAADSGIYKKIDGKWIEIDQTNMSDDYFNELLGHICPTICDDDIQDIEDIKVIDFDDYYAVKETDYIIIKKRNREVLGIIQSNDPDEDWRLIAAGHNPIAEKWEDGNGNTCNPNGW